MMIGSSESSQDYHAAAESGQDMSAFATVTSWNYDIFVKNTTSVSPEFTAAITKLTADSSDANMREFFSTVIYIITCLPVITWTAKC